MIFDLGILSLFLGLVLSLLNNILSSAAEDFEETASSFFSAAALRVTSDALLVFALRVDLLHYICVSDVELACKSVLVRVLLVCLA